MICTWLGWAGVELEHEGATVVIDPLQDAAAVFAGVAPGSPVPDVVPARPGALAGLVTHLHLDHADAGALTAALAPGAALFEPHPVGGDALENGALLQADAELDAAPFARRRVAAWETVTAGPFTLTAVPASDGIGDPQVSWVVEAGGTRVLHLGDTMYHGHFWRVAHRLGPFDAVFVPVNGAVLSFPHRVPASPLPGALDPDQAALAAALLRARLAVPIHADGYEVDGLYVPVPGAAERFAAAAAARGIAVARPELGGTLDLRRAVAM